jgi:hypothetical protein
MRAVGAQIGSVLHVKFKRPQGGTTTVPLRVVGTATLPTGIGGAQVGLGRGAVVSLATFQDVTCPPGPGGAKCLQALSLRTSYIVFVATVPGAAGRAALTQYVNTFPVTVFLAKPAALVSFGEAVDFPLIFGVMLVCFGVATLAHLLVVSVSRRRRETGLLKTLGFATGQARAVVYWQAATVALIGIAVGAPLGIAAGRAIWRAFALNIGVVPVPVVVPGVIAGLLAGVVVVTGLLALVPAAAASRTDAAAALRAE